MDFILNFLTPETIKEFGASCLMFLCFYLLLRSYEKNFTALIQQKDNYIKDMFEFLKGLSTNTSYNTGLLQEIKAAINTNAWCPVSKHITGLDLKLDEHYKGE